MDVLNSAFACILFVSPPIGCGYMTSSLSPATGQRIARWDGYITEAARRFTIPDVWIRSVMAQESAGFTLLNGKPITSAKGAMGLMQLMPDTWADMRSRLNLGGDPYDPHDNILAGAAYLRDMADRFGPGAFAAYNVGPGRYSAYLEGRATLPQETRTYLDRIMSAAPPIKAASTPGTLFIVNTAVPSMSASGMPSRGNDGSHDLFVPLAAPSP